MRKTELRYTFTTLGYVLFYSLLIISILLILTRKQPYWHNLPVYGEMMLYQQITSFSLNGMAVLIIGVWTMLAIKHPWKIILGASVSILMYNFVLETWITYANVPDMKDLIGAIIGIVFHLGILLIMQKYGFAPFRKK